MSEYLLLLLGTALVNNVVLVKFLVPVGPAMPWSLASGVDRLVGGHALFARYAVPGVR